MHLIPQCWRPSKHPDVLLLLQIYLDVGVASSAFKPAGERTLGDKSVLPTDAQPVGRIVLGVPEAECSACSSIILNIVHKC